MVHAIAAAKRFQDLTALGAKVDTPYLFDRIFSVDGWRARSLSKKKFHLLKRVDVEIRRMLGPDEKVHFITWGVESSLKESYFLGWALYYFNRRAFVFTNQRILLIQIGARSTPMELRSQIPYPAISEIRSSWLGNVKIKFRDGTKTLFVNVPRRDRKFMSSLVATLRKVLPANLPGARRAENLCPHCYAVVEGFPSQCARCRKGFKSASRAGWLSLLFPGFGDFYLGHRKFAMLEIVGASLVWLGIFLPDEAQTAQAQTAPVPFWAWVIVIALVFLFVHGADAWFTRHRARKGIYPARD